MNKKGFSKIEIVIIIFIVSVLFLLGISAAFSATGNNKIDTGKKDAINISDVSKNIYGNLEKKESEYISSNEGATSKGLCVTLKGLRENEYLTEKYKDWDGYLVIEKDSSNKMTYTAWITNGKYLIDGYTVDLIENLSLKDDTLVKEKEVDIPVSSFKSTTKENGGPDTINIYNQKCINEKIE